jgi:hypothetical protein
MREFLVRHKVKGWRRTTKGRGTSGKDFQRLEEQRPEFTASPTLIKANYMNYSYTLMPAAGSVLAYLDFGSMEFGVAAGLSQAPATLADYRQPGPFVSRGTRHIHKQDLWHAVLLHGHHHSARRAQQARP